MVLVYFLLMMFTKYYKKSRIEALLGHPLVENEEKQQHIGHMSIQGSTIDESQAIEMAQQLPVEQRITPTT